MKKNVILVLLFIFSKTVCLAQHRVNVNLKKDKPKASLENLTNQELISKIEFFVEGEDESQIKLNLNVKKEVQIKVTVFNSQNIEILSKTLQIKGNHSLYFDSSFNEKYRVVIESLSKVDFKVEKRNFL